MNKIKLLMTMLFIIMSLFIISSHKINLWSHDFDSTSTWWISSCVIGTQNSCDILFTTGLKVASFCSHVNDLVSFVSFNDTINISAEILLMSSHPIAIKHLFILVIELHLRILKLLLILIIIFSEGIDILEEVWIFKPKGIWR